MSRVSTRTMCGLAVLVMLACGEAPAPSDVTHRPTTFHFLELALEPGCFVAPDVGDGAGATQVLLRETRKMADANLGLTFGPVVAFIDAVEHAPTASHWTINQVIPDYAAVTLQGELRGGNNEAGSFAVRQSVHFLAANGPDDVAFDTDLVYAPDRVTYDLSGSTLTWTNYAFSLDGRLRGCDPMNVTSFERGFDGGNATRCWKPDGTPASCDAVNLWP